MGMGTTQPSHPASSTSFMKDGLHGPHCIDILYIFVFSQGDMLCLGEGPSAKSIETDIFRLFEENNEKVLYTVEKIN